MNKLLWLFLSVFLLSTFQLTAQKKLKVYVWDFVDKNGGNNKLVDQLTEEFEEHLVKLKKYTVLYRTKFADLAAHIKNEEAIQELNDIPFEIKRNLKLIGAEAVFFGTVEDNYDSGNIIVRVSLQSFDSEILAIESVEFSRGLKFNDKPRREKMNEVVMKFLKQIPPPVDDNIIINPNPNPWKPSTAQTISFAIGAGVLATSLIAQLRSNRFVEMHETATDPAKSMEYFDKAFRLKNLAINTFYVGIPILSGTGLWYGIGGLKNSKNNKSIQPNNYNEITMQHQIGITIKF